MTVPEDRIVGQVLPRVHPRKLAKVPYVELADSRLQGVVSSGSDIARVYVSFFRSGTHNFYCSTNNNRPCGGLRGAPCKHLCSLLDETVLQYGAEKVIQFLQINAEADGLRSGNALLAQMSGAAEKEEASTVFSRFLNHLRYLELPRSTWPIPELAWLVASTDRMDRATGGAFLNEAPTGRPAA